jgi:hypothetical protein
MHEIHRLKARIGENEELADATELGQYGSADQAKNGKSVGEVTEKDSVQNHNNPSYNHKSTNMPVALRGWILPWLVLICECGSEELEYEMF